MKTKAVSILVTSLLMPVLSACRIMPPLSSLLDDLPSGAEAWSVTGHDVRYGGAPVAFGPCYTSAMRGSGLAGRWVLSGRHVGFGRESRQFGFQMERDRTAVLGAGCGSSQAFIRLLDGRTQVGIADPRDVPALACSIWPADAKTSSRPAGDLVLWQKGWDIVGTLGSQAGRIDIASTRRLEGVSMPMGAPVAYRFMRDGRLVAHVDVLNPGVVRMAPGLTESERDWLAVAATAILMEAD